jgi:signal transduction histidine kinase
VKLSLPLRIFAAHLVFMIALGGMGVVLVNRAFKNYADKWKEALETVPAEQLFSPLASELARSLLLRLEPGPPERQANVASSVGQALNKVLPTLPSIERLIILDAEQNVQYASPSTITELTLTEPDIPGSPDEPLQRRRQLHSGREVLEVLLPVDDRAPAEGDDSERVRLGWALIHYSDSSLTPAEESGPSSEPLAGEGNHDSWVGQVAYALLRESTAEDAGDLASYKRDISSGLNQLISAVPLDTLLIIDNDKRIQYASDPSTLEMGYGEDAGQFEIDVPQRTVATAESGETEVELIIPVFDQGEAETPRRLGSVLIGYRPDPELVDRLPRLRAPTVGPRAYIEPLIAFFVMAVGGGILLAALSGLPVRRMEKAMSDFRDRGYKGGLDPKKVGLPADLASTVQAFSELGNRLEALDTQGRERQALLETLSQSLEDGMVAVDPRGDPVAWNPAALRILDEAGSTIPRAEAQSDEGELIRTALARNFDLQFVVDRVEVGSSREIEIDRTDGTRTLARVTQVPVELRPGVTGSLLLIRDLATLRKVETHLLHAGRYAVLAHLAAGLAHEIRNPLHAIQLNTTVVEQYAGATRSPESTRAVKESVQAIKGESQRLSDLLNNYLGLVRPGDEAAPVDLRELSRKVIQLVSFAAGKAHVEIHLEGEESPPMVHGVASRLQQAILNLVLNAIQAMPDGGTLTMHISSSSPMVKLRISDTGPGLPQELSDQLFDTRVTTKPGGSGLGLPLVRLIVESHGGGVWYRSAPGKGASFTLVLPIREADAKDVRPWGSQIA